MRVYLLPCGLLDCDRSVIHPGDSSKRRVTLPVMAVLIQNEGRAVLFDTGMPPAAAGDPDGLKREYGMDPGWIRSRARSEERIDAQLAMLHLRPQDLDLVVNTHFDFDHAGGNALVVGAPVAAQEAELASAREGGPYLPVWDAPGLQFRPVSGDWSPLPGVEMLHTPGHTPGHQSMLVHLSDRPWLFTWDAVYTEEHWRTQKLGAVRDVAQARTSLDRLRAVAAEHDARMVFGHDVAQWGALGMTDVHEPRLVASG